MHNDFLFDGSHGVKVYLLKLKGYSYFKDIDRFYYDRLQRSNMTNETKNIAFHVIHVKMIATLDVQDLYQ